MRKTVPQITQVICDFTGKVKDEQEGFLGASITFDLATFNKEAYDLDDRYNRAEKKEALRSGAKEEDLEVYDTNKNDYFDSIHFDLDLCEDVAFEVFNFLKKKYPNQMKEILSKKTSCTVVNSNK